VPCLPVGAHIGDLEQQAEAVRLTQVATSRRPWGIFAVDNTLAMVCNNPTNGWPTTPGPPMMCKFDCAKQID